MKLTHKGKTYLIKPYYGLIERIERWKEELDIDGECVHKECMNCLLQINQELGDSHDQTREDK